MILVALAVGGLLTVPLTGGHLSRLAHLPLRGGWLAVVALALQVVIVTVAPNGSPVLHHALHLFSYALGGAFVWLNRRLPGMTLIGLGAAANALAITVNGGTMPASAWAERVAGLRLGHGFQNSAPLAHPHLLWLGDIIPIPLPGSLANTLSAGDLVIVAGLLWLAHSACRGSARAGEPASDAGHGAAGLATRPAA